jgi:GntR family transcriptional regulator of vanillate catabolism
VTLSQNLTAALRLRELIIDGDLPGGARVSEIPLAERLGVSRTPLRLALAQLEHEGLLEALPAGGFAVRLFTRDQVVDAIDLRGLLEGAAARLAAEGAPGHAELEAINGCVSQLDRLFDSGRLDAANFEQYVALNERFHGLLIAAGGSEAVAGAYDRALALPFASPSAFVLLQADLPGSQRQHRDLLDAITRGEGARAEALAREHARLARGNLDLALESEERLARLPGAGLIERPLADVV